MQAPGYGYTDPMKPKPLGFDPTKQQGFDPNQQQGFGPSLGAPMAPAVMPTMAPPSHAGEMPGNTGVVPPFNPGQFGGPMPQTWGGQGGFGGQPQFGQGRPVWGQWGRQQQGQQPFNPTRWGG